MVLAAAPYLREAIDDDERRRFGRGAAIATALAALGYGLIGSLGSTVVGLTTQAVSGATMLAFHGRRLPRITGFAARRRRVAPAPAVVRHRRSWSTWPLAPRVATLERL